MKAGDGTGVPLCDLHTQYREMGEELVETLQTYFDCGYNRRETARRLHLADRTVAYRLEREEDLLGHELEGEAGRRLIVALMLRRLGGAGSGA